MSWPSDSPVGATSNGTFLVTNRYDFMSRRVEKASAAGTNSFIYDGWNLVREDIDAAPAAVAIVNADFADGLDGWTYSNVTADACGPQTVANFSSAGAWLEQDVGAVAGDEYVVSFRYHPFACGLAPGYGAYPWSVTASIGDATASTNGSYAPWTTWQGMSNFTFRLRPSVPGPLRIAVGGMPNPVVTHVAVTRLAHSSSAYVWGLDLSGTLQGAGGIGGLLVQRHSDSASPCFSVCDANGNITDLLDEAGSLAAHYEFDSYGNATVQCVMPFTSNPHRFSSKYCDDETALCFYGHRFYTPTLERWLSRDPVEEPSGVPTYCFNYNNPFLFLDADGRAPQLIGIDSNGKAIYGPDRDWGDWDPQWGGRGRILKPVSSKEGFYSISVEGHGMFGAGSMAVTCCNKEDGKIHLFVLVKICGGAQVGISAQAGRIFGIPPTCTREAVEKFIAGNSIEFGGTIIPLTGVAGVTGGISLGLGNAENPFGVLGGSVGVSVGKPIYLSVCHYEVIKELPMDCCSQ